MQQLFAGDFVAAVGDDLVGVHVGLGAAARLPDHQREVVVKLAINDFVAGLLNGGELFIVQLAKLVVRPGRGLFQDAEGVGDFAGHQLAANFEVLIAALGLRRPIAVGRHLHLAHGIAFCTVLHIDPPDFPFPS